MELFPACFKASISIAIVSIAVHVSMAKMLANQFGYKVDVHQVEFLPYLFTNILFLRNCTLWESAARWGQCSPSTRYLLLLEEQW